MKAAIYARVSKEEQHTENQLPELHEFATRNGWEAIEYLEEASGKEGGRRPVMKQLLEDAKARKFSVVVVWKIDRFGRSIKDFIANMEVLNSVDVRFVATSQPIDTDQRSPIGKMMMSLLTIFAEFERNVVAERIQLGVARSLREQVAAARYGRPRQSRSGKNMPHGAPRKIWPRGKVADLRAQGMSLRKIAGDLGSTYGSVWRACKENSDADALTNRGTGKQTNGDPDGAIADLTAAIQLKPDNAAAYRSRGLAKRAKNNMDGARVDIAKAMQLEAKPK